MSQLYTADGVNLSLGDKFSAFAYQLSKTTWNVPYISITDRAGKFRGAREWEVRRFGRGYKNVNAADGVGTKTGLGSMQSGQDLLAMTLGDITRYGALPLVVMNVLDVSTLGGDEKSPTYKFFTSLFEDFAAAAREQEVVLFGGETAELGVSVGSENPNAIAKFNWAGFAIGITYQPKAITGEKVSPGDVVVALRESGFRSNGISSVRAALRARFGDEWWSVPEARPYIEAASVPSVLYDRLLSKANGWYEENYKDPIIPINAIAHISGGGIPSKFGADILARCGHSAVLNNLFEPAEIVADCREWRGFSLEGAYEVWGSGQGALVVLDSSLASDFIALAHQEGREAQICGYIAQTPKWERPRLNILSKYPGSDRTRLLEWIYPG